MGLLGARHRVSDADDDEERKSMPEESRQLRRRRLCGVMRLRHASLSLVLLVLLCALTDVRAETCEEKGLVGQCK